MNTEEWGPPAWRILHGLAALLPARAADEPAVLRAWHACIRALRASLPCVYCRESFAYLSRPLPRRDVDVWWWHVHELVNIKLNKPSTPFRDVRARTRSGVLFSADDVWLLLGAMSCNVDTADTAAAYAARRRGVCAFIATLQKLLQMAAATAPAAPPFLPWLAKALTAVCCSWRRDRERPLLHTLAELRSSTAPRRLPAAPFVARVQSMCVALRKARA